MADQDHDGSHIKGLVINFVHKFYPSLLKIRGFIQAFVTPIIKVILKPCLLLDLLTCLLPRLDMIGAFLVSGSRQEMEAYLCPSTRFQSIIDGWKQLTQRNGGSNIIKVLEHPPVKRPESIFHLSHKTGSSFSTQVFS